jgi:hypothetical protein
MQNYETLELIVDDTDLELVLTYLLDQVNISIPYCAQKFGTNNNLTEIWAIGKRYLVYHQDDKNIEQIQSVGTLFENNIHGKSGHGDCDCFTVFTLAMLLANWKSCNIKRCAIVLQGNSKEVPSHILTAVYTKDNECIYIDFTEKNLNQIRKYNYLQIIKLNNY